MCINICIHVCRNIYTVQCLLDVLTINVQLQHAGYVAPRILILLRFCTLQICIKLIISDIFNKPVPTYLSRLSGIV